MHRVGGGAGRRIVVIALLLAAAPGCRSELEADFPPGDVTLAPSIDPRARDRVSGMAREIRAWLTEHYGPPTTPRARIVLLPDDRWLAEARDAAGVEAAATFSYRPGSRHLSFGRSTPPAVILAPCFGSYARPDALARWLFDLEWARDLPPWLREGLSETVGATVAAAFDPLAYDRTLDHLLPHGVSGARQPFPQVLSLAAADPREAAARYDECAWVVAAATDGGAVDAVRELLASPPRTETEISAFATEAQRRATRFPSLRRVVAALEERPRASSTTALVEAATPSDLIALEDRSDAALDRFGLEAALASAATAPRPERRRLAIFGLGRLGTPRSLELVMAAAVDPSALVRATALVARARLADRCAAAGLLDLARDAPVEEAPGRVAHVVDLFDRLTGYRPDPPSATEELSLTAVLGVRRGATLRPRYREIERREAWLDSGAERQEQRPREAARTTDTADGASTDQAERPDGGAERRPESR